MVFTLITSVCIDSLVSSFNFQRRIGAMAEEKIELKNKRLSSRIKEL